MTAPLRAHQPADLGDAAVEARARLRAAPPLEPPYDDETPAPVDIGIPLLSVVPGLSVGDELPFDRIRRGLRAAGRRWAADDDDAEDAFFGHQPTPRLALSDPGQHAARLLRAVLEVLARRRPLHQLLPWTSEDVYEELTAWMYRTARPRGVRYGRPATLRSLRIGEPADGIAEITGVVVQEDRARAVALRLEGVDGRWCCTLLRML